MTNYAKMRISNPTPYFETPDQVLSDDKLTHDEKVKVLKSMAIDADQLMEATSEGMDVVAPAYSAEQLQSALIQLEKIKDPETVEEPALQDTRFQRIVVVTTVNQDLNREIVDVAIDMAEVAGGKVYLLNVVPSEIEEAGLMAAGPMVTAVPLVTIDNTKIIKDRVDQLAELAVESDTSVETEIEVRSGHIEQVIVDYADDCDADVIVVGSPNRSWLEALFNSPISRRVTRSAPCPVLVVPEQA